MIEERRFEVRLYDERVGVLRAKEDYTWFTFDDAYLEDPNRPVLGLAFEERPRAKYAANLRLPPWFSNLLPEGKLRDWIAADRGVSPAREMLLLERVGRDLPGAVTVVPSVEQDDSSRHRAAAPPTAPRLADLPRWRFSLAGVQMKLSQLQCGDRFVAPATGEDGDWIIKLPDAALPDVPAHEYAAMSLARAAGLDVPEVRLVPRDAIAEVPASLWPRGEEYCFGVKRFDRLAHGRVHIEDLAQVRGYYPDDKYRSSFETVLNLVYRGVDSASLIEAVRRLALHVLVRNGDAHLKNWSLIFRDRRRPQLAPLYDVVSTVAYLEADDLGMPLNRSTRFEDVSLQTFTYLQRRLGVTCGVSFVDEVVDLTERVEREWPEIRDALGHRAVAASLDRTLAVSIPQLRRR